MTPDMPNKLQNFQNFSSPKYQRNPPFPKTSKKEIFLDNRLVFLDQDRKYLIILGKTKK